MAIINILHNHGIETRVQNGRIEALDVVYDAAGRDVSSWVDCTDWTVRGAKEFLGY